MGKYRLLYDRVFVAEPEFKYKGHLVVGAAVGLLFRFFKDGEEVFFEEGDECSVCDNVICSYDNRAEDCCSFRLKPYLVEAWFDKIDFEIVEWELVVFHGIGNDVLPGCPEELGGYPVYEGMKVSRDEFAMVLRKYCDNFDNNDNLDAQGMSVGHVEA